MANYFNRVDGSLEGHSYVVYGKQRRTKNQNYLQKAEKHFAESAELRNAGRGFSWDEKNAGVHNIDVRVDREG